MKIIVLTRIEHARFQRMYLKGLRRKVAPLPIDGHAYRARRNRRKK